jgi:hypothetical protein
MANSRPDIPMLRESDISAARWYIPPEPRNSEAPELLELNAPTIVFGGPYSNLEATRALLQEAERLDIPAERMICTGDVVAYCADGAATVDLVRSCGARDGQL